MVVMFYNSDFTAVLGFLDKVDSHFYLQLFSARVFVPQVNDEMISILDQVKPFNLVPSEEQSVRMSQVPLDGSSLERWRVPSQPVESFLQKLKSSLDQSSQSSQAQMGHKLMMSVRDSYVSRAPGRQEKGKADTKFDRKPSTMSNASTSSVASSAGGEEGALKSRKSKSRAEILRDLSVLNRSSAVVDSEVPGKKEVSEKLLLRGKNKAAVEMRKRMGDPADTTDLLIERLESLKSEVIAGGEDISLAGYSEACISHLLDHLETSGASKAGVEEVVTARLLSDVATVAASSNNNLGVRVSQHCILAHLRQMLLHGRQSVMTDFLSGLL